MKTGIGVVLLLLSTLAMSAAAAEPASFIDITQQTVSHGFRATAVYLNDADQPFGARFVHDKTGFTLDLIEVQSVPQAFTWVNSFPVGNQGEPHTQEHLLVGKGNTGRAFAAGQSMSLTESSAFTEQWRTCYHFNTKGGLPVFYGEFQSQINALLHPDYTDEEIRREVRNFGVSEDAATHELHLEEKGTVYNEMVSSMAKPNWALFRQMAIDQYGAGHPLAYNSGGEPSGIRTMQPADIRAFHERHYFLGNMGSIVSLPKGDTVAQQLGHFDEILNRAQPAAPALAPQSEKDLPAPQPFASGAIQIVDFPFENEKQASYVGLAWPANRSLSNRDSLLMELFFDSFAGDAGTNLYRLFVNSKTRKLETGASSVFFEVKEDQGFPVTIGLTNVAGVNLTEAKVSEIRAAVMAEFSRIAALPDGSPELAEFNALVRSRLVEQRRELSKLINSPPGFGARGTGTEWIDQLYRLNREAGFRKTVTERAAIDEMDKSLAGAANLWRDLLPKWHITDTIPFGVASRPSAALLAREQTGRLARATAEVQRLGAQYGTTDAQATIRRYRTDYDAESARLDSLAQAAGARKFLDAPPMTLDDQLEYAESKLPDGVPMVSSYFDNMTSASTSLALRLDTVPEADLPLLSVLPSLLSSTGVIDNGKPVAYEDMQEMLRRQILSLNARFSSNVKSNRVELVISGSGNNLAENKRAIEWIRLVLAHSDWRIENLPRLRDLAEQTVGRLRNTMQGSEEAWVMNPVLSYWKQNNPLYLTTTSFLTREWNADRLRWMLKDVGNRTALAGELAKLAAVPAETNRDELKKLADGVSNKDLATDLGQLLADLPEASLSADWSYICNQLRADILLTPETALTRLSTLRDNLLKTGNARVWVVGSRANLADMQPAIIALTSELKNAAAPPVVYTSLKRIDNRLRDHQGDNATPRYTGLFDPNLTGGVVASVTAFTSYDDPSRDAQLNYLASRLFAGYGEHGIFTKTIGAGLAYSNGMRGSLHDGYAGYYAERTPEIPQTLHFVVGVIQKGPRTTQLAEYAIALAFGDSNASGSYEARAEAIANDLADGLTPAKVRRFRENLLALRREPNLAGELFRRMDANYSKMIPGYGGKAKDSPDTVYFIIGSEKQFHAMDADVQAREDEHVYKLYPRDYWLVPKQP